MMPKEGEGHPPKKFRLVLQGLASLFWRLHLYTALPRVGQPFILKFGQDLYNLKDEGPQLVTSHLSLV